MMDEVYYVPPTSTHITLRDYFAAAAIQTMPPLTNTWYNADHLAKTAYAMADAMLKAGDA